MKVIVVDDDSEYSKALMLEIEKGVMERAAMEEKMKYQHLNKKERYAEIQPVRTEPKIGRNEKCPCGSNKKYKNCCLTT